MFSDYEIARLILRRPRMVFSEARTLRDVLALLHGVAVGRYPPHGSGFLPGFGKLVQHRFKAPPIAEYSILLKELGDKPYGEACDEVLGILEEWEKRRSEPEARSEGE